MLVYITQKAVNRKVGNCYFFTSPFRKRDKAFTRRPLPEKNVTLDWGVVKAEDVNLAKDLKNPGKLLEKGNVSVDDRQLLIQTWLNDVYVFLVKTNPCTAEHNFPSFLSNAPKTTTSIGER